MKNTQILISDNKNIIDKVVFNYPSLMKENAEEEVKSIYYDMLDLENQLSEARKNVYALEEKVKRAKENFNNLSYLFEIEFKKEQKEYRTNTCNMAVKGETVNIV